MILSPEIKQFIKEHASDDIHTLALSASKYSNIDFSFAIQQIRGRQIAREKIPSWYKNEEILYPRHLSMEQCSSEYTARYKTTLCSGNTFVDLTGGFGVDTVFLGSGFKQITYIERQEELTNIAQHNFRTLGLNIEVIQSDAVNYLQGMHPVDCIYIDPARRDIKGRKTVFIEDCTPNILEIENLLNTKAKQIIIKLSPMLDISLAVKSLKNITDIHVISHNNECKELLFIKKNIPDNSKHPLLHCITIKEDRTDTFTFSKEEEDNIKFNYTSSLGKYLYEPNSAIMKAGAYKSIAQHYRIDKLHVNSHLYTSDILLRNFQGRLFEVIAVTSLNKKDLKNNLRNVKQANISTRNFPLSPQELKKRLNLKDGGDIYIFGTTLADDHRVLVICKKL